MKVTKLMAMVLSQFLGEECQGCGKVFMTLDDLKDTVYWPWEKGRIGHKQCYERWGKTTKEKVLQDVETGVSCGRRKTKNQ